MNLVVERMSAPVVYAYSDTPLGRCARLMMRYRFRHLPVVDEDCRPLGMIEDLDVFRHGALLGPDLGLWLALDSESDGLRASDVMHPVGGPVSPGTSFLDALVAMRRAEGSALVVIDEEGRLTGVVTEHDAVTAARDLVSPSRLVAEIARFEVSTIDWLQSASEALGKMRARNLRHLVVLRDRHLHGVISLRDLVAQRAPERCDFAVHDAMRAGPVVTTSLEQSIRSAASTMVQERIGCLPMLDPDLELCGLITRTDLHAVAVEALERVGSCGAEEDRVGRAPWG